MGSIADSSYDDTAKEDKLAWHSASDIQINQYQSNLDKELEHVSAPKSVLECKDKNCTNTAHNQLIDTFGDELIQSCMSASQTAIPKVKQKKGIPKWNELGKPAHETAMFWHSIWLSCGKPTTGDVYKIRQRTRAQYHRVVKDLKRQDITNRSEKMARSLLIDDNRNFWKESKKFKPRRKVIPDTIDGIRGGGQIAEHLAEKFNKLYNSVPYGADAMDEIRQNVKERLNGSDQSDVSVTVSDIQNAIQALKAGKSDGYYGLESDHLIHSTELFQSMLCEFIVCNIMHGHMAECLSVSMIVQIPKDYKGSLIVSDNYRGICLCSSIVKVMDIIMLNRSGARLYTSDLQFAYKSGLSTTMCTLILKEVAQYYKSNGTSVYACLLDASKAFDKIKFDKLFQTLLDRQFPAQYINLLIDSYCNQDIRVCWGRSVSSKFHGMNGVRQGGVISPILFIVYIDELITHLKECQAGCWIGHYYYGSLVSADDISLLSPSVTGLQKMVDICANFGVEYVITFNEKKTVCLHFNNTDDNPDILLNGKRLVWKSSVKHLGNIVSCNLEDGDDILLKKQDFYNQVNVMIADYQGINFQILTELFNKYCTSFYGSQAWDLRSKDIAGFYTAWNKAVQRCLGLPYNAHRFLLPQLLNVPSLETQLAKRFCKLCKTMYHNKNSSVSFIFNFCAANATSFITRNLFYICNTFKIKVNDILNGNVNLIVNYDNEVQTRQAEFVRELLEMRDKILNIDDFNYGDIQDMIDYVSAM